MQMHSAANTQLGNPRPRSRPVLRPHYQRVKSGCLTCRRRRKKCDEAKPRCAGCRRNQILCEWPISGPEVSGKRAIQPHTSILTSIPTASSSHDRLAYLSGECRACDLTAQSHLLLRHYMCETGVELAVKSVPKNPFLACILPLASSDDILMHSILALSGTHIAFKNPGVIELEKAALTHYVATVHGVREALARLSLDDDKEILRILLILIMLCHYEVVSGDLAGKLYPHLCACRELVQRIYNNPTARQTYEKDQSDEIMGFCLELYAYMIIANSVAPCGTLAGKELPYDVFVCSLSSLSDYPTFGVMFGEAYQLFQLIPRIALLASDRWAEEEEKGLIEPSTQCVERYEALRSQITNWSFPNSREDTNTLQDEQFLAAECFRHGLYIYLITALAGTQILNASDMQSVQGHVACILNSPEQLEASPYMSFLLWPVVIAGTCLLDPQQQYGLVNRIRSSRYQMRHVHACGDVLEMLWADTDPRSFGPLGLHRLKLKGIWVPIL